MAIQESGEMYLESIYVLTKREGRARSIDVAEYLKVSRPSVSQAVGTLRNQGYITVEDDGSLMLTESGKDIAVKIYERHTIISRLLTCIGVSPETAVEDACKIEHDISDETFEAIKAHLGNN